MPFNTAVFYDIENLLKGYSFSQQMAANLSLKDLLGAIKKTPHVGQIAVQRAYANWSDPRLAIMRGDINELGIEPIQVFGFSRDQKKNAADIQLAIDAIDLAHVRPALDVYVVVSGDGGFASLAKKLHEYGKTVIGCAYRSAANKIFQTVCDEFLWVTDPEEEEHHERERKVGVTTNGTPAVTDPRNVRLAKKIKPHSTNVSKEVLAKAKEVLNWYVSDATCAKELGGDGIPLSAIQEAVRFAVPGFQSSRFGFIKFSEYLQYACQGTPLCVARPSSSSQAVLMRRDSIRRGAEILPDIELSDFQTVEGYRLLLARGNPVLRLPPMGELRALARWVCEQRPRQQDLATLIESAVNGLEGAVSAESAKFGLLTFASVEVFQGEPDGVSAFDQKLTLQPDVVSPESFVILIQNTARAKLRPILGEVREEVLQQLLE